MNYKKQPIKITDLLINPENPRFDPVKNQKQALSVMIEKIKPKIKNLAEDISQNGLNPGKLWYVTKNENKFLVLEGNRRLTALKLIINPNLVDLDKETKNFFQNLKDNFGKNLPNKIDCVVFNSKEDAYRWIELEHTGENNGIGLVKWNSEQANRFKSQVSGSRLAKGVQVLDFMRDNNLDVHNIDATNIDRLISTPYVREQIGINFDNGSLILNKDKKSVVDNLKKVSEAMNRTGFNVGTIYTSELRKTWIDDVLNKNQEDSHAKKLSKEEQSQGKNIKKTPLTKQEDIIFGKTLSLKAGAVNNLYLGICKVYDQNKNNNADLRKIYPILGMSMRLILELAGREYFKNDSGKSKKDQLLDDFLKVVKKEFRKQDKQQKLNYISLAQDWLSSKLDLEGITHKWAHGNLPVDKTNLLSISHIVGDILENFFGKNK
jgi:hypothetical protein